MFQHILVPLDGSGRAEEALPMAAHLARSSQAVVTLLRIAPRLCIHQRIPSDHSFHLNPKGRLKRISVILPHPRV